MIIGTMFKIIKAIITGFAFLSKRWIKTLSILILWIIGFLLVVAWSVLNLKLIILPSVIPAIAIECIVIIALLIFMFLSIIGMLLRFDLGIIHFNPTWRKSPFDLKKMFNEADEIWYLTTVGRFLHEEIKEADFLHAMTKGKKFKGLFLEPHGKQFQIRMKKERPSSSKLTELEPSIKQINFIRSLLSISNGNIQIRWYDFQPAWRLIIFKKRYVVVGWFPDYKEKSRPEGNENKGYSGPMIVLDKKATMREVSIDIGQNSTKKFPMSTLAKGFIDYFESVWKASGEDLKLVKNHQSNIQNTEPVLETIETEYSLKKLTDIGINTCWQSEELSPYSLLTNLLRPDLKKIRYLELSARATDVSRVVDFLRKRTANAEQIIDCDILLYDPRTDDFKNLIEREGQCLSDAVNRQSEFISQLIEAKHQKLIKELKIRFLHRSPCLRSAIIECEHGSTLFLGYYKEGSKGYRQKIIRIIKDNTNDLYDLYENYFEQLWNYKDTIKINWKDYQKIRDKINLMRYLDSIKRFDIASDNLK
jgi:hypothetical protein